MSCNTLPPCCNAHRFVATPHPCDVATPRNPLPSLRLATLPPLLQRLSLCFPYCDASRPFATFCNPWQYFPLPLTVRVCPTSCNAYLALMQHPVRCKLQHFPPPPSAHLRSMSCNTPMRALYLATPRTQPFPRVRMSCNTPQSALSPRAHVLQHPQSALPPRAHTKLQHLTVRPSPACACLATPHSPHFPHLPCAPYVLQHVSLALMHHLTARTSPACPRAPMYCLSHPLAKCSTLCSILEY